MKTAPGAIDDHGADANAAPDLGRRDRRRRLALAGTFCLTSTAALCYCVGTYPVPPPVGVDYPTSSGACQHLFYSTDDGILNTVGDLVQGASSSSPAGATRQQGPVSGTLGDPVSGYAPGACMTAFYGYAGVGAGTSERFMTLGSPKGEACQDQGQCTAGGFSSSCKTTTYYGFNELYTNDRTEVYTSTNGGAYKDVGYSGTYDDGSCSYGQSNAPIQSPCRDVTYSGSAANGPTTVAGGPYDPSKVWGPLAGKLAETSSNLPIAPTSAQQASIEADFTSQGIPLATLPMVALTLGTNSNGPDYRIDGSGTILCDPAQFGNPLVCNAPWRLGGVYCRTLATATTVFPKVVNGTLDLTPANSSAGAGTFSTTGTGTGVVQKFSGDNTIISGPSADSSSR